MGDLSTNFSREEFACQCGCGLGFNEGDISHELIVNLEAMRRFTGRPIFVTSGCRCKAHNKAVGGVDGSVHTMRPLIAADLRVYPGAHEHDMHAAAHAVNVTGVGIADNSYIHVDWHDGSIKARPAIWVYK
jgi:uncharacterized protein YcbK (DUF882 family)